MRVLMSVVFQFSDKMRPIFCGNFDFDARSSDLERLFRRYGKVDRVDMKSGNYFDLFLTCYLFLYVSCSTTLIFCSDFLDFLNAINFLLKK